VVLGGLCVVGVCGVVKCSSCVKLCKPQSSSDSRRGCHTYLWSVAGRTWLCGCAFRLLLWWRRCDWRSTCSSVGARTEHAAGGSSGPLETKSSSSSKHFLSAGVAAASVRVHGLSPCSCVHVCMHALRGSEQALLGGSLDPATNCFSLLVKRALMCSQHGATPFWQAALADSCAAVCNPVSLSRAEKERRGWWQAAANQVDSNLQGWNAERQQNTPQHELISVTSTSIIQIAALPASEVTLWLHFQLPPCIRSTVLERPTTACYFCHFMLEERSSKKPFAAFQPYIVLSTVCSSRPEAEETAPSRPAWQPALLSVFWLSWPRWPGFLPQRQSSGTTSSTSVRAPGGIEALTG
jgi:hypothetical protein